MPNLMWRPDLNAFRLHGESHQRLELAPQSGSSPIPVENLQRYIKKLWETADWTELLDWYTDVLVQLSPLEKPEQDRMLVGVSCYWPGEPDGLTYRVGYMDMTPSRRSESRDAKRGVRRLSEFMQKLSPPVLCEAQVWLKEESSSMTIDGFTIEMPYEDELAATMAEYFGPWKTRRPCPP